VFTVQDLLWLSQGEAYSVVAADLNNDGKQDIAAATVDSVMVLLAGPMISSAAPLRFPAGRALMYCRLVTSTVPDVSTSSLQASRVTK
jgi:hypothetical protein